MKADNFYQFYNVVVQLGVSIPLLVKSFGYEIIPITNVTKISWSGQCGVQ